MKEISLVSQKRNELIDITGLVQEALDESGFDSGTCIVFCPHTTAAITINENADFSVQKDILSYLSRLVPPHQNYLHSEGNSDAHIKGSLVGASSTLIVRNSKLVLGTWQGVYFCEFDGPRSRKVYLNFT